MLWATSHINPEAPGQVSDSCACTLCHLLSCLEVKGTYSQGSAMWASFVKPEQRAQNPNPYFMSSDLLTHLDLRIACLCFAAGRRREHTVLCLKIGNADEMRTSHSVRLSAEAAAPWRTPSLFTCSLTWGKQALHKLGHLCVLHMDIMDPRKMISCKTSDCSNASSLCIPTWL